MGFPTKRHQWWPPLAATMGSSSCGPRGAAWGAAVVAPWWFPVGTSMPPPLWGPHGALCGSPMRAPMGVSLGAPRDFHGGHVGTHIGAPTGPLWSSRPSLCKFFWGGPRGGLPGARKALHPQSLHSGKTEPFAKMAM